MKKIILTAVCLSLGAIVSLAQTDTIHSTVSLEDNFRNALWFNGNNAAGMRFTPLSGYHELKLTYDGARGVFHLKQLPEKSNAVNVNTSGALELGGILLWGDFSFKNIFEDGAKYNSIRYIPEEDMPYSVADSVASPWTKQEYLLSMKAATPLLWDHVAFGTGIDYESKVGAKQRDPRVETYRYKIEITPGAVATFGKFQIGLSAMYRNDFERAKPSNEGAFSKVIWQTRGLGEFQTTKVGDNDGLKEYYYKENAYGAGLQLGYSSNSTLLADFSFTRKSVDCFHNVKLPKRMGSTRQDLLKAKIQALLGGNNSHKIELDAAYSATDGLEYIQTLNTEAFNQNWDVVAVNRMSAFNRISAVLKYDWEIGNSDPRGYDWKLAADAGYLSRDYSYTLPASSDNSSSVFAGIGGFKQFKFDASSLVAGIGAGYNKSLGGEYIYGGLTPDAVVLDLYRSDNAWYTTDYAKSDLNISFTKNTTRLDWFAKADASYIYPFGFDGGRLCCLISAGIIF